MADLACYGEQAADDAEGIMHPAAQRRFVAGCDIPVRRYGTVPPPPEPEWEIESGDAQGPRTIAEYGGTLVLLAGLAAAAVAGYVLYLR